MPHLRITLLRAICTVLLDPRDPLLHSERTQGFAADPDYWKGEVFAYVGRNQNLKDLKDLHCTAGSSRSFTAIRKDAGLYCGSRLLEG
jgi:hypothetical protein